jgi:pyrroline-5-carboxylate reductase
LEHALRKSRESSRALIAKLAIIGSGQMAEALIGGLVGSEAAEAGSVFATDISAERTDLLKRRFGIRVGAGNREAASWAETVLLAIKPQTLDAVLKELAPAMAGRLLISIAAGVTIERIAALLPPSTRIVRAMPNAPALVCAGMSAVAYGPGVMKQDKAIVQTIFQSVGRVVEIDERFMDAVTGLSGSGPAYVCVALEALADGGVKMGLPRSVAQLLAAQTALGAAQMLLNSGEHPARLKDRVASPGGTTIAGLHVLERGGLRACLIAAVEAATRRARELSD